MTLPGNADGGAMNCTNCGRALHAGERFCAGCGTPTAPAASPAAWSTPPIADPTASPAPDPRVVAGFDPANDAAPTQSAAPNSVLEVVDLMAPDAPAPSKRSGGRKRFVLGAVAGVVVLTLVGVSIAQFADDEATTGTIEFVYAPGREFDVATGPNGEPEEAWDLKADSESWAVTAESLVYVESDADDDESIVYGVSLDDGRGDDWDYKVDSGQAGVQRATDSIVLVTSSDFDVDDGSVTNVTALDASNGEELWSESIEGFGVEILDSLVISLAGGCCTAYDVESGDEVWSENADAWSGLSAAGLYVNDGGDLVGIEIATGEQFFEAKNAVDDCDEDCFSRMLALGESVYVLVDERIHAFDQDGDELWDERAEGFSMFAVGERIAVVGESEMTVFTADGDEVDDWEGDEDDWAQAIVNHGDAVLAVDDADLLLLDSKTGEQIERVDIGDDWAITTDYVVGTDGTAYEIDSLDEKWSVDFDKDATEIFVAPGVIVVYGDGQFTAWR